MAKGLRIRNADGVVQIDSAFTPYRLHVELDTNFWRQFGVILGSSNNMVMGKPAGSGGYIVMISPKNYGWSLWRSRIIQNTSDSNLLDIKWQMSSGATSNFFYRIFQRDGAFIGGGTRGLRIRDPLGQEILDSRRRYLRVRQIIQMPDVNSYFPETYSQTYNFTQYEGRRVWFSFDSFGLCNVGANAGGIFTNSRVVTFNSPTQITVTAVRTLTPNASAPVSFDVAGPRPASLLIAAD